MTEEYYTLRVQVNTALNPSQCAISQYTVEWNSYLEHTGEVYVQIKRPQNTILDMRVLEDKAAECKIGQWRPDGEWFGNGLELVGAFLHSFNTNLFP